MHLVGRKRPKTITCTSGSPIPRETMKIFYFPIYHNEGWHAISPVLRVNCLNGPMLQLADKGIPHILFLNEYSLSAPRLDPFDQASLFHKIHMRA